MKLSSKFWLQMHVNEILNLTRLQVDELLKNSPGAQFFMRVDLEAKNVSSMLKCELLFPAAKLGTGSLYRLVPFWSLPQVAMRGTASSGSYEGMKFFSTEDCLLDLTHLSFLWKSERQSPLYK